MARKSIARNITVAVVIALVCVKIFALEVEVHDDERQPVASRIFVVDKKSRESYVGQTTEGGILEVQYSCQLGDRVKAEPHSHAYYHSQLRDCFNHHRVEILVTARKVLTALHVNGAIAEKKGNYGDAALIYSEIATRAEGFDRSLASKAFMKAHENAARALEFKSLAYEYHPYKGITVTPKFRATLLDFQGQHGLKKTGELDYRTLRALSDHPIGTYIGPKSEGP